MKTRYGFVSNSSSSSFVIKLDDITAKQLKLIECHEIKGRKIDIPYANTDAWGIEVSDDEVRGETSMDNFNMRQFLENIGVPANKIKWGD